MILKHASSQKIWITIFLFASSFSRGSKIENWYKPLHKWWNVFDVKILFSILFSVNFVRKGKEKKFRTKEIYLAYLIDTPCITAWRVVSGQIERSGVKKRITALWTKEGWKEKGRCSFTNCLADFLRPSTGPAFGRWHFATFVHPGALHLPACVALTRCDWPGSCHGQVRWFPGFFDSVSPGKTLTNQEIFDPFRSSLCSSPNFRVFSRSSHLRGIIFQLFPRQSFLI